MIAADTSTWIAFLEGDKGEDVELLDRALQDRQLLMVPIVLTELLSDPKLPNRVADTLSEVPMIEIEAGFWQRAGALRAKVLSKQKRARLGDALIAQACVDRGIPLITRDRDFRAFAEAAGLEIVSQFAPFPAIESQVHTASDQGPTTNDVPTRSLPPQSSRSRKLQSHRRP